MFRAVISITISWFTLKKLNISVWGNDRKTLFVRGFSGTVALLLYFYSIQTLPLASAVTLQYLSPIFSIFFAYVWLKENLSKADVFLFFVAFLGVYMIKGFDVRVTTMGAIIAVSGAVLAGVAYTMVRKLKDTDHPIVVIFYFPLVTIPLVGPFAIYYWQWPRSLEDWLATIGVGVFTHMAQYTMTLGYQGGPMKFVSLYKYVGVIIAIFAGYLFFDEGINWQSFVGMFIILASLVLSNYWRTKSLQS